jgi:hypothetical protein
MGLRLYPPWAGKFWPNVSNIHEGATKIKEAAIDNYLLSFVDGVAVHPQV